jgi:CheY-like chemotaxis protein
VTPSSLVLVLVEDDHIDAIAIRRSLTSSELDFEVHHFPDGDVALEAIRRQDPDAPFVLVLDVNRPRLPGLDLLELLRQEGLLPSCPVLVLTTSNGDADRARALSLGADAYLSKSDRKAMTTLMNACEAFAARGARSQATITSSPGRHSARQRP